MYSFLPLPFFSGWTILFLRQIVNASYFLPFGKVWLSSVCCPVKVICRINGEWVKLRSYFFSVCRPKLVKFWDGSENALQF